jgi:transcriptional regulator with XRE-family HTH domain
MPAIDPKINLVAEKIRERREFMNYTQQYVAGQLNITQNAYSKIECGRIAINIRRLFQIAAALETDAIQFLVK